jgi:hypothetical protein
MKKVQEEYDKGSQDEKDWAFKNTTSVTKLIDYLTMAKYIQFVILIHDPTTIMFNEYKYRQIGVTCDSESEDEDATFCKKYNKKEASASDSFFVSRAEPGDLEPVTEHAQVGKEAMGEAVDVRENILLKKSQAMVLAACWRTLEDIETFSLFPSILSVDTTIEFNIIYFNCAFTKLIVPKEGNITLATMPARESWVGARLSNSCYQSVGLIAFTVTIVSVVFCIVQI